MAFIAAAIIGGVGALAGGAISAFGASSAANTQSSSALSAAQIQAQSAQNALNFQQQQFQTGQNNLAPWLGVGRGALANLGYGLGIPMSGMNIPGTGTPGTPGTSTPGGFQNPDGTPMTIQGGRENAALGADVGTGQGTFVPGTTTPGTTGTPDQSLNSLVNPSLGAPGYLSQPFTQQFQAPTGATEQNDPGYQFRLQQGQKLLENSAAAKGDLLSGGTAQAEQQFGQDYASNEYGNVYNRALGQYQQNYNIYQNNQANSYNRLASLAGVGQTSANQLTSAGQAAANNTSNLLLSSGASQAAGINNAAAARASGYVGGANALSGSIGGIAGNLSQLSLLNSIYGGNNGIPTPAAAVGGGGA